MATYYNGSQSTEVSVLVEDAVPYCEPECINKQQWACDDSGQMYNTGEPCVQPPADNLLLLMGMGAFALVGTVMLVGTGKKGK